MITPLVKHVSQVKPSSLKLIDVVHVTYGAPSASMHANSRSYHHVQVSDATPRDARYLRETIANMRKERDISDLRKALVRKVKQLSISGKCESIWAQLDTMHADKELHTVLVVAPSSEVGEAVVTAINQIIFGNVSYKDASINHYVYGHMIAASSHIAAMRWIKANPTYTWKQHLKLAFSKLCTR